MTHKQPKRRTVPRTASGIAVASLDAGCAGNGGKASKADVSYVDHPKNGHQCSGCQFYIPPEEDENAGKCSRVKGTFNLRRGASSTLRNNACT